MTRLSPAGKFTLCVYLWAVLVIRLVFLIAG